MSYVVSGTHPSGNAQGDSMSLYGVSKEARDREIAERLKKVGAIEIRDANRPLAAGEAVFKAQCVACHGAPGIPAAPHLSDAAAWGPRIGQGYATLLEHALKGKGAMPPQGGGDFEDVEIGRAVVYLANAGGAKFPVPDRPAAAAARRGRGVRRRGRAAPAATASAATQQRAAAPSNKRARMRAGFFIGAAGLSAPAVRIGWRARPGS